MAKESPPSRSTARGTPHQCGQWSAEGGDDRARGGPEDEIGAKGSPACMNRWVVQSMWLSCLNDPAGPTADSTTGTARRCQLAVRCRHVCAERATTARNASVNRHAAVHGAVEAEPSRQPQRRSARQTHRRAVRHRLRRPADPRHDPDHHGQQRRPKSRRATTRRHRSSRSARPFRAPASHPRRPSPPGPADAPAGRPPPTPPHRQAARPCPAPTATSMITANPGSVSQLGSRRCRDVVTGQRRHPQQHEPNQHARQANPVRPPSPLAVRVGL